MIIDDDAQFGLSKRRYQRDKKGWAQDEASSLYELLSYSRRYWRKAVSRKTSGKATRLHISKVVSTHP